MSKRLEQFIKENREAFEAEEPPMGWEKLQASLQTNKSAGKTKTLSFLKWAAAALFILFASILYSGLKDKPPTERTASANGKEVLPGDVAETMDPDYTKQVYQFAQLIKAKQKELQRVQKAHPQLYREFMQESRRLDSIYRSLTDELAQFPNEETLLGALIENLQWQLSLLNRQLQIVKQLKNKTYESKSI